MEANTSFYDDLPLLDARSDFPAGYEPDYAQDIHVDLVHRVIALNKLSPYEGAPMIRELLPAAIDVFGVLSIEPPFAEVDGVNVSVDTLDVAWNVMVYPNCSTCAEVLDMSQVRER